MVKFVCNKIGRDKGPERFQSQDITCHYKHLEGHELAKALKEKLIEEAYEVQEAANPQELISELADILEVINGLCKAHSISLKEIETIKEEKHHEHGGFEKGFYVETIEMDESNPRVEHFRKSPQKYPEIKNLVTHISRK